MDREESICYFLCLLVSGRGKRGCQDRINRFLKAGMGSEERICRLVRLNVSATSKRERQIMAHKSC